MAGQQGLLTPFVMGDCVSLRHIHEVGQHVILLHYSGLQLFFHLFVSVYLPFMCLVPLCELGLDRVNLPLMYFN